MAADIGLILRNLAGAYDFSGKDVVYVGAGGGRLLGAVRRARRVRAVDIDAAGLEALRRSAEAAAFAAPLELVSGDFGALELAGDVVYFEFCLHEMPDPAAALARALRAAPEAVVLDHLPDSAWAALACEEVKAAAAWAALERFPLRSRARFEATQAFRDHAELHAKLASQGPEAVRRMEPYRGRKDFSIPMTYGAAVLERSGP